MSGPFPPRAADARPSGLSTLTRIRRSIAARPRGAEDRRVVRYDIAPPRRPAECSTLVELAGRMNISADEAIRQFMNMSGQ